MQYLYVCNYSYFLLFQNGKVVPVILPPDVNKHGKQNILLRKNTTIVMERSIKCYTVYWKFV